MSLKSTVVEFPGLSQLAFQHPLDRQARAALERIRFLPQVVKNFSETVSEGFIRSQHISGSVQVTSRQYPSLYRQYVKLAQVLDLPKLPGLYISTKPMINAYALGVKNYFIVVNSGLVELMTTDELLAIIGHELGHVKCEQMRYVTLVNMLRALGPSILEQLIRGIGQLDSINVQLALLEWYRKAKFSCDRAALLATQDSAAVCSALTKLAGYSKNLNDQFSVETAIQQAEAYHDLGGDSVIKKMVKLYAMLGEPQPYPVVRVKELSKWARSAEYSQILSGQYPKTVSSSPKSQPMLAPPPLERPAGFMDVRYKSVWPVGASLRVSSTP